MSLRGSCFFWAPAWDYLAGCPSTSSDLPKPKQWIRLRLQLGPATSRRRLTCSKCLEVSPPSPCPSEATPFTEQPPQVSSSHDTTIRVFVHVPMCAVSACVCVFAFVCVLAHSFLYVCMCTCVCMACVCACLRCVPGGTFVCQCLCVYA